MTASPTVIVHLREVQDADDVADLQEALERRCQELAEEFHEADRFEIHVTAVGNAFSAQARASGKKTDVAAQGTGAQPRPACDAALDRLARELRSRHDKRIFKPRRQARRDRTSRKGS